jgi:carbohydrate diacid regulator
MGRKLPEVKPMGMDVGVVGLGERPLPALAPSPTFSQFDQFAASITEKVADLLQTNVLVANKEGLIIASNPAHWCGQYLQSLDNQISQTYVTTSLSLEQDSGELRIYQQAGDEELSSQLVHKIVRMVIDQALLVEQLPGYRVLKDKFIYNLLHEIITDSSVIELHANNLGLNLTPPRAVLLIDAADYLLDKGTPHWSTISEVQIERRVNSVINWIVNFFALPNDTICAYIGQGEIAILKASDTKNLVAWADKDAPSTASSWANLIALKRAAHALLASLTHHLKAQFTIGVGRHHPGIPGLALSYQDARAALSLGRRFFDANRVHCLDELGIAAFVGISDERIKVDLAMHILSPLDHEPELLETLVAFFATDCSPSPAARRLAIHRNTLNYRLDKITSLTGLDPRHFDDAVQIRLSLLLRPSSG